MKLSLIKSNEIFYNYSIKIRPPWLSGGSVITWCSMQTTLFLEYSIKEEVIGKQP
jgi:hypothetical protein